MEKLFIDPNASIILNKLNDAGYEAYIVGGCVRDSLLGIKPKDWDITTNATPKEIKSVFSGYSIIPTGEKHGTMTVRVNHENYEVTTYRTDGEYLNGRHPEQVVYSEKLEDDLKRRDFTINAMAYSPIDGLIDIFGGQEDLRNRVLKTVGDANERFSEDYLRIMRAVRFAVKYDLNIEENTLKAIYENMESLNKISKERIADELSKTLVCVTRSSYIEILIDILSVLYDDFSKISGIEQNNPYHVYDLRKHIIETIYHAPNKLELKLAMLFHDTGKAYTKSTDENGVDHFYNHANTSFDISKKIMRDLRFPNKLIDRVTTLVQLHDMDFSLNKKTTRRRINAYGYEILFDLIEVKKADILAQNPRYLDERLKIISDFYSLLEEEQKEKNCTSLKTLAVKGDVFVSLGLTGSGIGEGLKYLLEKVVEEPSLNKKELLTTMAAEYVKNLP